MPELKDEITFKTYFDQRIADLETNAIQRFDAQQLAIKDALVNQEKAINVALVEKEKAIIKADLLTDKRFDSVNESIAKMTTQNSELLPRAEYVANHKALDDKIVVATDAINRSSGDKNLYATNAYVTQTVNQAISSLETKMESILTPLVNFVASQKGAMQGSQMTKSGLISAISITGVIIGIVVFIATTFVK